MNIHLESRDLHTIHSYSNEQLIIAGTIYKNSLIISKEQIISPWEIHFVQDLTEEILGPMVELKPEIIIIGHQQESLSRLPMNILQYLSRQRIGIECMSLGAACRTFNVLLSEHRNVIAGIIFQ